jgi:Outer membrane protein beta-barrel domain
MPIRILALLGFFTTGYDVCLWAQESKINTSLGVGMSVPVGATGHYAHVNVNTVVGAGYNFTEHHALIGEFMYSNLPPTAGALQPISAATQVTDLSGSGSLFTLTGNYRYMLEGKVAGAYLIGGGGLYYRVADLKKSIVVGPGTVCGPSWQWWGYTCVSGIVSQDKALINSGSGAFGGNVGVGFTLRVGDEGYKVFFESRYHYAPNRNIATQLITTTIGIRF